MLKDVSTGLSGVLEDDVVEFGTNLSSCENFEEWKIIASDLTYDVPSGIVRIQRYEVGVLGTKYVRKGLSLPAYRNVLTGFLFPLIELDSGTRLGSNN